MRAFSSSIWRSTRGDLGALARRRWSWPGRRPGSAATSRRRAPTRSTSRKPRTLRRSSRGSCRRPPDAARRCAPPPAAWPSGRGGWPPAPPPTARWAPLNSSSKLGAGAGCHRRRVARARRRAARAHGQEGLHDPVFQRMEGDHAEPAAGLQRALGGGEAGLQLGRAPRSPRCAAPGTTRVAGWILAPRRPPSGLLDELGQLEGAGERLLGAAAHDGARRCGGSARSSP